MPADGRGEEKVKQYGLKPYDPRDSSPSPYIRYQEYEPEKEVHFRDYLNIILKRKKIVLTFFVSVVITTTILTAMVTPLYKSTVVIKIDKESPNILSFKEVQAGFDVDSYATQLELLKSRSVAERVIRKLGLEKNPDFVPDESELSHAANELINYVRHVMPGGFLFASPHDTTRRTSDVQTRMQEDVSDPLVNYLIANLEVKPIKNSQLVRVSYWAHRPDLSANVANTIAEAYIERNLESRIEASKEAKEFLEKQSVSMKAKVESSEQRLNEYASRNEIIFVDKDKQSIMNQKLSELSTALNTATTEKMQREALHREIRESGADNPVILNNPLILNLKQQHASLEAEYFNLSKTFTPDYPKMQNLKSQIDAIQSRIDREKAHLIKSVESDYRAALKREANLKASFETQKKGVLDFQEKSVQYQILKREVDANKDLYNSLLQRLNEVGVVAMSKATNVQVVDRAILPKVHDRPNKIQNILLSIILGFMGGVGLAFLVEYFDNTVVDVQEIEKRMHVPSLGMIPLQEDIIFAKRPQLICTDGRGPLSEVFRSISTFILFSSSSKPPKTILITSPGEKEGKSTISLNLAVSLAGSLGNGVIIDADLRKPKLHHSFELNNKIGLSNCLSGDTLFDPRDSRLVRPTHTKGLNVITTGPAPANPSELLFSSRMKELLDSLCTLFNFVIIDAPPVMGMSDSVFLSTIVDGTILVVKAGETTMDDLVATKKIFRNVNTSLLGVVLNGVKKTDIRYGYDSHYLSSYFKV